MAMPSIPDTSARILEIEARQDEALRQLADLEQRVEQALAASVPLARETIIAAASFSRAALRREAA
ncbi:MAG TPA: hypothetical protein VHV08_17490 [Pirellulales bacterium]|nr:hypothetical protein [Pirellulales bacterium]